MDLMEPARERYSVRKYDPRPVEGEKLDRILEAGALAPSAKNQQPQHVYVLESPAAIEKIRSLARCAFDAPVVLLVCGDKDAAWTNPFNGRNSVEMDCSILATHMMLEAQAQGLGTCWVCWFDTQAVKEAFDLPAGHEPYLLMPLGYPAESSHPSSNHASRRPLSETVTRL